LPVARDNVLAIVDYENAVERNRVNRFDQRMLKFAISFVALPA
jgi:hypothetical protein